MEARREAGLLFYEIISLAYNRGGNDRSPLSAVCRLFFVIKAFRKMTGEEITSLSLIPYPLSL